MIMDYVDNLCNLDTINSMLVNENKDNSKRNRYQSPGWWGDFQLAQLDGSHLFSSPPNNGFRAQWVFITEQF